MIDNEILDEIASCYAEHKELPTILEDLKQGINLTFWAHKFCTQEYYENFDMAQSLFEYALNKCEDYRDYKELAFAIARNDGFNDQEWARDLINTAITKVTLLRDLRVLADDMANANSSFHDRNIAFELYKEAIEKSESAYDFYCIAESLCQSDLLDDKDWAQDVYQKAVEAAQDADELTYIADSIADDDNLGDEQWAEELYAIAQEFEQGKELE